MVDGAMNDDATASVTFTSLQPFIVPVLVLFATVAWWKRRAPVASQQLVRTELGWRDLPDELVARIATLVPLPMQNLPRLALVERRCRQPSAAQLYGLRAAQLHDLARAGDVERISHLFHEEQGSVMLLLNGRTILHTAIEARQLGVIQWLVPNPTLILALTLTLALALALALALTITPTPNHNP